MSVAGTTPNVMGVGRKQAVLVVPESAIGTLSGALTTGKRVAILGASIDETVERSEVNNKRETPNITTRLTGKTSGKWNVDMHLLCGASAGSSPDLAQFLKSAGFTETLNGGVDAQYALNQSAMTTFGLLLDNDNSSQLAHGCVTESIKIKFDGNNPAKISFSGKSASVKRTGTSTLSGVEIVGQTVLSVTEAECFNVGAYVQVGTDNNSGDGFKITNVDTSLNTITINTGLLIEGASGAVVGPVIPVITMNGTPISGILGAVTLGGTTLEVTEGEIEIELMINDTLDKFGSESYDAVTLVDRRVKANLTLFGNRDGLLQWMRSKAFSSASLVITIGTTSPNKVLVTMPYFEMDLSAVEIPEVDQNMIKISGVALKSSGNDELTLKMSY